MSETISKSFTDHLNEIIPLWNFVPIWEVALVGLLVALVVHSLFNRGKSGKRSYLSPVLWVVLTVLVLFFWSDKNRNGQGGPGPDEGEKPVAEEGTDTNTSEDGSTSDNQGGGEGGTANSEPQKPIALEIRFSNGKYTITDQQNSKILGTNENLYKGLLSLNQSGYVFTSIETIGLTSAQNNYLKDTYNNKGCKVNTKE